MRIGIMTLQRDALIPAGLPASGMLAHLAAFDHADLAQQLHAHGFSPIELSGDMPLFLPDTLGPAVVERLLHLKAGSGVCYTVHLPLWSVEPSTPLTAVREGSVRALIETVHATLPLQPELYVLHATGAMAAEFYRMRLPEMARALILRQFQTNAAQSVETLLRETGIHSRRIAVETVEFPFELTLELAEQLDLSICLDTGHLLVGFSGPISLAEALELSLPRLGEVHLHDGPWQGPQRLIGYGQDHRPLGMGDLDIPSFLARLEAAGFGGPIILELTLPEALQSMELLQSVRPHFGAPVTP